MKVVSVMTSDARGGAEFAALRMLDALTDRGHETVMLTNDPAIGGGFQVRVRPIEIGPKLSSRTWLGLMARWLPYVSRLRTALEAEWPYDLLLVHFKKEQLMAPGLPPRLRAKLVWAEWGPVPVQLRSGIPRRMYLRAARDVDRVMAVSDGTRASVCAVGIPEDKVTVVPNAVRTGQVRYSADGRARVRRGLGVPDGALVVGCMSRFQRAKRNDVVIDAVMRLGEDYHLILAGEGDAEAELRARAQPLGRRVHFLPTLGKDPADALSAFDVSVFCPSPTEGVPLALILAMLAERPCVATGAEGAAEVIGDGVGMITSPEHDPAALADAIRLYGADPERRAREGAEGRRRAVARHDASAVAERIERLLLVTNSS